MPDYPITEKLKRNASIHCATLVITQDVITGPGWPHAAQPDAALRNGTLTFVKSDGRTYGITCQHVVQHYRDVVASSGNANSHSLRTMLNGFYVVMDRFVQPQVSFGEPDIDVAIRELSPALITKLGKEAMDLDQMAEPPEDMGHAYAVGFPEQLKYHKFSDQPDYRVSMPQVEILAELPRRPDRRFAMFSELEKSAADIDYSGMSGGPIFWSTEDRYGIVGIVYEGGPGEGNNSIFVYGELVTPAVIKGWIAQCLPPSEGSR